MSKYIKLSNYAKNFRISCKTAYRYWKDKKLKGFQDPKTGLFKVSNGKLINADLNGALNILRKVVGEFKYPIEVCSTPLKLTC